MAPARWSTNSAPQVLPGWPARTGPSSHCVGRSCDFPLRRCRGPWQRAQGRGQTPRQRQTPTMRWLAPRPQRTSARRPARRTDQQMHWLPGPAWKKCPRREPPPSPPLWKSRARAWRLSCAEQALALPLGLKSAEYPGSPATMTSAPVPGRPTASPNRQDLPSRPMTHP